MIWYVLVMSSTPYMRIICETCDVRLPSHWGNKKQSFITIPHIYETYTCTWTIMGTEL